MKSVKKAALTAAIVFTVIVALAGCKSSPGPAPEIKLDSTAKVETIEHKGTALGIGTVPQWLSEYMQRNGVRSVEALPDYKDMYVIIGEANGPALQQVLTWSANFDAQQQIGAAIRTRVASLFKAKENLLPGESDSVRKYDNAINTLVTGTYSGARKESDWWIHQKITEKGNDPETRYTAYVLFTIAKKTLNDQIANEIVKLKEESPELGAAYDAATAQLLDKGLEWE